MRLIFIFSDHPKIGMAVKSATAWHASYGGFRMELDGRSERCGYLCTTTWRDGPSAEAIRA